MNEYNNDSMLPMMMTVPELAEFLRVSKNTAYGFVSSGAIPSVKVGRQIRICRNDVICFTHAPSHT